MDSLRALRSGKQIRHEDDEAPAAAECLAGAPVGGAGGSHGCKTHQNWSETSRPPRPVGPSVRPFPPLLSPAHSPPTCYPGASCHRGVWAHLRAGTRAPVVPRYRTQVVHHHGPHQHQHRSRRHLPPPTPSPRTETIRVIRSGPQSPPPIAPPSLPATTEPLLQPPFACGCHHRLTAVRPSP